MDIYARVIFVVSIALASALAGADGAQIQVGDGSKCKDFKINIFAIDRDIDDAHQKYAWGKVISVSPGEHEIWYSCERLVNHTEESCLHTASLKYLAQSYVFGSGSYLISCDSQGVNIEPKS